MRMPGKMFHECPQCGKRQIVPANSDTSSCPCRVSFRDILVPILDHGRQLVEFEIPAEIRKTVLENVKDIPLE
jgi:hypothetical protein